MPDSSTDRMRELARLEALASYDILDSLPEADYDAITQIASQLCGMPMSAINLISEHEQWSKSMIGLSSRNTPRHQAFCTHTILAPGQLLEVHDARVDSRFAHNPLTTGQPAVIFYAGVPLVDEEGYALGALCVIDEKPNQLTEQQRTILRQLARQVVLLLTLRRNKTQLEAANEKLRAANHELHESNQMLQAVVDNCPAALILWQARRQAGHIVDFDYVLTNPVNAGYTGYRVDQLIGSTLKNRLPADVSGSVMERLVRAVETGSSYHFQKSYPLNGVEFHGDFQLVPLGDRVLVTYQDISQHKQNEEQLRLHSEDLEQIVARRTAEISQLSALQNAILEHVGSAIISTDTEGIIQTVNPATQHLFGYQAHELLGRQNILFLYDLASLVEKARELGQLLGKKVPVDFTLFTQIIDETGYECVMRRKNGRRIPTFLVSTPLRDKSGTITGYVIMATDITALKAARTQLRQRDQELNTFFEVSLDLHVIATDRGDILKVNRAMENTLGYSRAELMTMNYYELVHPDDRDGLRALVASASEQQGDIQGLHRFLHRSGTYRLIEWNMVVIDSVFYSSAHDVTERVAAEERLEHLNQRLQLATRAASQGVWEYDAERDLVTWDKTMCAIHGLDDRGAPLTVADYERLIHPDDLPSFTQWRNPPADGNTHTSERRIIRPDGMVRFVQMHKVSIFDSAGNPIGLAGVCQDITERKQAEAALRQSEERYRALVENLQEVVYQTNRNRELTFLNPYWTTMTGYSVAESLGQPATRYYALPIDQEKTLATFNELMSQQSTSARLEVGYLHKSGEHRWAEIFCQPLFDEAGQPNGLSGTITDITERKTALDVLRQSEQRFRDIAENISEIFWIHSADPIELLYINPAYEQVTGLSPEPLYTNPLVFMDMVLPSDRPIITDAFVRYMQGEEVYAEYRAHNVNHEVRWFAIRTFVKKDSQGRPVNFIGIATDITHQKDRELSLQQSLRKEQELNQLKSQFVSTASHEFRTPLATIQSSVDLIKLYVEQPPAQTKSAIQRHLGVIEKEITNFSNLLSDILTFGRIEANKVPFNPQPTDMAALVDTVVGTHFSERIDQRKVQITLQGTPRPVVADAKLFSHVLINLLSNAFKFSTDNPALQLVFDPTMVSIIVTDTGIGIPADEQVHLFDTFFRASNAVNIQGSGLGLVIARQFILQHGGQFTLQSEEHVGTTCTITLPG